MRVLATGYFDSGNLGDDAMKQALDEYFVEWLPDIDLIWQSLPDASFRSGRDAIAFLREMRRSEKLLLVGGTHFHDDFGFRSLRILFTFCLLFAISRVMNCRPSSVAIGIGPLRSSLGRRFVSFIMGSSELTIVRDELSFELARSLEPSARILQGVDLAFLIAPRHTRESSAQILGISVIPYFGYIRNDPERDKEYVMALARGLASLVETSAIQLVHVIVACASSPGGDAEISRELYEQLMELDCPCRLIPYTCPEDFLLELDHVTYFVCSRYHALLLSQLQSVPVLLLPYQEKCVSLADQLGVSSGMRLLPEDSLRRDLLAKKLQDLVSSECGTDISVRVQTLSETGLEALHAGFAALGLQRVEVDR